MLSIVLFILIENRIMGVFAILIFFTLYIIYDNIPKNQKSIAISVTIQSLEKTLTDNDLEKINKLIIETVENKTGAKIRS